MCLPLLLQPSVHFDQLTKATLRWSFGLLFAAFAATAHAQIIINEIMRNPDAVSDTTGEWFEVYNAGLSAVDINGWTISDRDIDSHVIVNGGPLMVLAGGFLVLGRSAISDTNGGVTVDYQYSDIFLANTDDELILLDSTFVEVDSVEWDGGATFPNPVGASMALVDPVLDNSVGENWCASVTAFGDGDLGTPGAENVCTNGPTNNIAFVDGFEDPVSGR